MRTLTKFVVMVFMLLLPFAFYTPSASAAPAITVVNNADSGPGSLRQAIADLDTSGTITFDPILNGQTITLATGELALSKNMTIDGGTTGIIISVNPASPSRVFNISGGTTVTMNGLTVSGGYPGGANDGGGIYNGGTLTCTSCTVSGNTAALGAGIYNAGTLTCSSCTFNGNVATGSGGGLFNSNNCAATLNNCTITSNSAYNGGGIYNVFNLAANNCTISSNTAANFGGGVDNNATFTPANCIFSGNSSNGDGGGLYNAGTGLTTSFCTFSNNTATNNGGGICIVGPNTLETCTFTGNQATAGGGVYCSTNSTFRNCTFKANTSALGSALNIPAPVAAITNCTFDGNGGGAVIYKGTNTVNILNCIIWNNVLAVSNPNGTAVNNSVIQGGWTGAGGTNTGADPLLGVLTNNGSAIQTMALLPGSPCINAGYAIGAPPLDARGIVRDAQVDIGAFESRGFNIGISAGNNQSAQVNTEFASPLQVSVASTFGEPVNGGIVTFSPPGSGASAVISGSPATIASGSASVTATANGTLGGPYTVTAAAVGATSANFNLTNIVISADVSITKSYTGSLISGGNVSYTIIVTNTGPDTATSVTMADTLPTGTTFVSLNSSPGWTCSTPAVGNGGTVTGSIASLASGASASFTLTVNVTAAPGTTLTNTATVSSSTADPSPGNNSSTSSGTVIASADLAITKTHSGDFTAGANAAYTITVTNNGPSAANSVIISDTLPADTTFVSLAQVSGPTWTCSTPAEGAGGTVTGSIASLASGASASFTLTVNVTAAPGTTLTNTATVSSSTTDPTPGNNSSTSSGTVVASTDVSITKSHTGSLISGENVSYSITVTNSGLFAASSVNMSDTLPAGTTFVSLTSNPTGACSTPVVGAGGTVTGNLGTLAPGASAVFTLTVNVDATAGTEISNTATVASTTSDPNGSNNTSTDTATVLSPGSPGVTVAPVSLDVDETGANVSFTVCLDTYPTSSVTIPVSSSDTSEITVSPATLTFTSGNWSTPLTVTVSPVNDGLLDGNQTVSVILGPASSADTNYGGLEPADVAVIVRSPANGGGGGGAAPTSPTVITKSASPVSGNSVVLQGSIGSDGTAKVDKYGFMYGNQSDNLDKQAIAGTSDHRGDFSFELTGLGPDQTYFFKAYTVNNNGQMIYGNTLSFTTNKAEAPAQPPVQQKFSDVPSTYWAYAAINQLVDKGCVNGYRDGTFRPDANITRAEFITMLVKALNLKSSASTKLFTDTAGHWAKENISIGTALGIAAGYKDGSFKPDALITREEMAIMVLNAAKLTESSGETSFSDNHQISNWAKGGVLAAVNNRLMSGYPDNTFRPQDYATRAEAVSVVVKLIK